MTNLNLTPIIQAFMIGIVARMLGSIVLSIKGRPRELRQITQRVTPVGEAFFHGTDSSQDVASIISEGLRAGSSVSSSEGQASSYGIVLEYGRIPVRAVSYRPGDFVILKQTGKPRAIYVDVTYWGKGVRPVDDINRELSQVLGDLEARGVSPEAFGAATRVEQYRFSRRGGELMDELDRALRAEEWGVKIVSGEEVLKEIQQAAGDIPVRVMVRDAEGDIDWIATRSELLLQVSRGEGEGKIFQVRRVGGHWEIMLRDEWVPLPLKDTASLHEVADHVAMFRRPPFTIRDVTPVSPAARKVLTLDYTSRYEGYYPFDVLRETLGHRLFSEEEAVFELRMALGWDEGPARDLVNWYRSIGAIYEPYPIDGPGTLPTS